MTDYAVVDPLTDEQVMAFSGSTDEEIESAAGAATRAFTSWGRGTEVAERATILRRVAELHRQRRGALAAIIVREVGKPVQQALIDVDFAADIYEYYADNSGALLADQPLALSHGDGTALLRSEPLGPILGIMPWNYPYYQVARFVAPTLVGGNTVLLKPAPQCPESALAIEGIFRDAGAPVGIYATLFASNAQIATLVADDRVRGVSLTGSESAGSAVAELAGRHLKKVVLELGGSDPFILLATDDIDAVVDDAVAARLENSGQACNAAKRFIVQQDLYAAFAERFVARLRVIRATDPRSDEAIIGPVSSRAAADRLEAQIRRAVEQGARVLVGGGRTGNMLEPTVLTDVAPENDAYREEFFGPVAVLTSADDEADAIKKANDTPYGLGSYVYTSDPAQALRVASALDVGMVYINVVGAESAELPFGGVKGSGFGRELGTLGIGEFLNRKLIRIG